MSVKERILRAGVYWELVLSLIFVATDKIEYAGVALLYAILFVLMTSE